MLTPDRERGGTDSRLRVLAIPGSLRVHSYNRALLDTAVSVSPDDVAITVYEDLGSLPHFNEDLEPPERLPSSVSRLRRAVALSDGLLIATPEYNHSVPGALKNGLDWLSRADGREGLSGLPIAITGVTTGPWGTRLAQAALRQILAATGSLVLPDPMLFVHHAASVFDDTGALTDATTRLRLGELLTAFRRWMDAPSVRAPRAPLRRYSTSPRRVPSPLLA